MFPECDWSGDDGLRDQNKHGHRDCSQWEALQLERAVWTERLLRRDVARISRYNQEGSELLHHLTRLSRTLSQQEPSLEEGSGSPSNCEPPLGPKYAEASINFFCFIFLSRSLSIGTHSNEPRLQAPEP